MAANQSRRSRKKRRTEDFSSDSSSSSSSDEGLSDREQEKDEVMDDAPQEESKTITNNDITIDNLSIKQADLDKTKSDLQSVLKIDRALNSELEKKQDLNSLNNKVNANRNELLNLYLNKMLHTYGDDLNNLRQSNDFNSTVSLSLLANLLKQNGNIFSDEVLKSITED